MTNTFTLSGRRQLMALLLLLAAAAVLLIPRQPIEAQETTTPPPVQRYFIPMPEDQLLQVLNELNGEAQSPLETVISIVVGANNTLIYYDQWEDGYEFDVADAQSASTLIWGDGNPENGAPPGYADDMINAGDVIVLRNDVAVPREGSEMLFDGRDYVAATKLIAITRAGWPVNDPGSQLAGAVEVYANDRYGNEFIVPVGVDTPSDQMFEYVGLFVMAEDDGTTVELSDGDNNSSATLGRGESRLFSGVRQGATVSASAPVQVYMVTGDVDATYEARLFTLFSRDQWSDSYYSPVATTAPDDGPTYAFIYNPHDSALTVQVRTADGPQDSLNVPATSIARHDVPQGSGVHYFTDDGRDFYAISTIDSDSSNNQIFDWGFTLIPARLLSPAALVGWGPGNLDRPCTPGGAQHPPANPVWVMATNDTDLLIDYDGNPGTGSLTDANGNQFDQQISVKALESVQLFDSEEFNGDFDQTGMRIYVIDEEQETNIAATWGQDPTRGTSNSLCNLDMGTSILPVPNFVAAKAVTIVDGGADGEANPGDTLEYRVIINQQGPSAVPEVMFSDPLPQHTRYVEGSASVSGPDAIQISDDDSGTAYPFDEQPVTLGDLGVDEQFVVSFQVVVDSPFPVDVDNVRNQAIVRALDQEARPEVRTPIKARPDLTIEKTDEVAYAQPGETVVYTLQYSNVGDGQATGVVVTDTVPAHTTFASSASSDGWSCEDGAAAGTVCRLQVGTLSSGGDSGSAEFAVTVDPDLSEGVLVENVTIISDDGTHGDDLNPDDNRAEEDTPVPTFDADKRYSLVEDVDGDGNVDAGDVIRYQIVISQTGAVAVPDVTVIDPLPEFTNYISGTTEMVRPQQMTIEDDTSGTPFPLDETAFSVGELAVGEVAQITFDVRVDECFVDRLFNEATIAAAGREQTVVAETPLDTGADLALIVSGTPDSVATGEDLEMTLTVVNVGNGDATDVTLLFMLPDFATLDATESSSGWRCSGDRCSIALGSVDSMSAPSSFTLALDLDDSIDDGVDALELRLRVTAEDDDMRDPAPGNNIADVTIAIEQ